MTDSAQAILKAIKQDRKTAEHYLLCYDDERKKYELERADYISMAKAGNELDGHDPTARTSELGVECDEQSERYKWLRAVEIAAGALDERHNIFLTARRAADNRASRTRSRGRRGWVVLTQRYYYDKITKRYPLDESGWLSDHSVKEWWRGIVSRTAEIAIRIKTDKKK